MSLSEQRRWPPSVWIGGLLIALLAACQPIPQPFAHDGTSNDPVIAPRTDFGGVTVLSVSGAPDPTARALLAAMADSLADHEIPAATGTGNRLSRFMQGSATTEPSPGDRIRVALTWDLFDRSGTLLSTQKVTRTIPATAWIEADRRAMRSLTDGTAAEIAPLILHASGDSAAVSTPRLHVWPVDGVPAGDSAALQRAMEAALRRRNFAISTDLDGVGLVIAGQFVAGPAENEQTPIEITWAVLDVRGQELGKLTQRNAVPAAALDKGWKSLVAVIAENAAGGVSDLVHRLPPEALGAGPKIAR